MRLLDAAAAAPAISLSAAEARRTAIAAQGLTRRPRNPVEARHLRRTVERLGLVQIDSVNVLARAHYLPLFSRLGVYATADLDLLAYRGRRRALFEYWGHEASLLPLSMHPLLRWRMERARAGEGIYGGLATFGRERRPFIDEVLREVTTGGAMAASDLALGERGAGGWWGWGDGKRALEWLFWAGHLTTATRRATFERVYDLPKRALPSAVLAAPTPPADEAQRALLRHAAHALGVATERDLRDYFRLPVADTKARLAELVEAGDLLPARVEGWKDPAFLDPDARCPRRVVAAALLAPFDPLIWERERTERLFGVRFRLEIYTPAAKRLHGYYVLPFLLGDRIVARLDLKADRTARRLVVVAAHAEPGAPARTAAALAAELRTMASWLDLSTIAVNEAGDLSPGLRTELAA